MTDIGNLIASPEERDFHVWINPQDFFVQASIKTRGQFSSAELINPEHTLPFVRDNEHGGLVSPFMKNVTQNYGVEFNLEQRRLAEFIDYPCRMVATFLFLDEETARRYADRNPVHVDNRLLQKVKTVGDYVYSIHDSSWIDYLRIPHFWTTERVEVVTRDYWRGTPAEDYTLTSFGQPWSKDALAEVLYLGTVEFYDTSWAPEPSVGAARVIPHEPSEIFRKFFEDRGDSPKNLKGHRYSHG